MRAKFSSSVVLKTVMGSEGNTDFPLQCRCRNLEMALQVFGRPPDQMTGVAPDHGANPVGIVQVHWHLQKMRADATIAQLHDVCLPPSK